MKTYLVTFHERAVVTEVVAADSAAEAIRLVKDGQGERVGFDIDEIKGPTAFRADAESGGSQP